MILGLHHVQITVPVSMEAAAIRFYEEVLSLPRVEKPPGLENRGGTWFQLGSQQLHLGIEDGVNRRTTKAHVAYEVEQPRILAKAHDRQRSVADRIDPHPRL